MPSKSVVEYTCDRCGKTWYENEEVRVASLEVKMMLTSGEVIEDAYEVLCSGCEKTSENYAKGLIKKMTKKSPEGRKSGANEKGADAPSSSQEATSKPSGTSSAGQPARGARRPPPSGDSVHPSK